MDRYNTETPTSDAQVLLLSLVVSSEMGEITAALLARMYPSPIALTN